MLDLLGDQNECNNPPSVFKQLQALASNISRETKRLQSNIISVGEHPHLYDSAANELTDAVAELKKQVAELDAQASMTQFSTFIESTRQQLKLHQRHADRIQLYIEKYGYKAPAHSQDQADTVLTSPYLAPAETMAKHDPLCELLSPELSASSRQPPNLDRFIDYNSTKTAMMPSPQSVEGARARYKDSSRAPPVDALCPATNSPSPPPTPAPCSPIFKVPIVKVRKPTDCESITSTTSSAGRPVDSCGDDDVGTPEPFRGQQVVFKPPLTSATNRQGAVKSDSSSALKQPPKIKTLRYRNDDISVRRNRTPPKASPGPSLAGGGLKNVATNRCFATPNTKKTVEDWLQSVRSKQSSAACSPSPLQLRLPKRHINNPLLQDLPSRCTPLRNPVQLQVSSASPDLSSRKHGQQTLTTKGPCLQKPPSPPSLTPNHVTENSAKKELVEVTPSCKLNTASSVSLHVARRTDEDAMSDSSLEEPVLSETTMNVLAELARARASQELKSNESCPQPPATKVGPAMPQPEPRYTAATAPSREHDANEPIDYSFKVPVPLGRNHSSASSKITEAPVPPTRPDMAEDLSTTKCASATGMNGGYVTRDCDTPDEPVLCSDYSKHFESNFCEKDVDTPDEPVLFSNQVSRVPAFDTPEEPVLSFDFSKHSHDSQRVQEVDTPEEPTLNNNFQHHARSYELPDSPEEPTLSVHGQRAFLAYQHRPEPPVRKILEVESDICAHPQKTSINSKPSVFQDSILNHKPNPPQRVQRLLEDDDFVDQSPELSNASKKMLLDRRQGQATDVSHSEFVKGKYGFAGEQEKENVPPSSSFSLYPHKSVLPDSTQVDTKNYATDDNETDGNVPRSSRPKPVFETSLEHDLDMSSLKIGAGNESLWNNSSLMQGGPHSGQSRRGVPNHSFSQAMLQYSHVKASPMPPAATARAHRHHPTHH